MRDLFRRRRGVQRDEDAAGGAHTEINFRPLGRVGREQRHPVAGLDAEVDEALGDRRVFLQQLGVGLRSPPLPLTDARGGALAVLGDGGAESLDDVVAHGTSSGAVTNSTSLGEQARFERR